MVTLANVQKFISNDVIQTLFLSRPHRQRKGNARPARSMTKRTARRMARSPNPNSKRANWVTAMKPDRKKPSLGPSVASTIGVSAPGAWAVASSILASPTKATTRCSIWCALWPIRRPIHPTNSDHTSSGHRWWGHQGRVTDHRLIIRPKQPEVRVDHPTKMFQRAPGRGAWDTPKRSVHDTSTQHRPLLHEIIAASSFSLDMYFSFSRGTEVWFNCCCCSLLDDVTFVFYGFI